MATTSSLVSSSRSARTSQGRQLTSQSAVDPGMPPGMPGRAGAGPIPPEIMQQIQQPGGGGGGGGV